jgi:hypothetical protein
VQSKRRKRIAGNGKKVKMEITKEIIEENLNDPMKLENLYQSDKNSFSEIIKTMYEPESNLIIKYWYTRLFFKSLNEPIDKKSNKKKYIYTAVLIIIAWVPLLLYSLFPLKLLAAAEYLINAVPAIFTITLSIYFMFDSKISVKNIALCILPNVILYVYFLLLPKPHIYFRYENYDSQSIDNARLFMFILYWFFVLFAYSKFKIRKLTYSAFLEIFGETVVWSIIFLLGGIIVVVLSYSLFQAIDVDIVDFVENYVITLGLVACPFVALLVAEKIRKTKLSVIIANIFLPLILFPLLVFGIISIFTDAKPYDDRDIFIIYNSEMVVVVGILIFTGINKIKNKFINICSYILPVVTIFLDFVTISAVVYRLSKYGVTANKVTLLGTNIIMLGHLVYMVYLKIKQKMEENTRYLPFYFLWAAVVVFLFPFLFKK